MRGEADDFRFIAENSADVIWRVGPDRVVRYISPSCLSVFGWTAEEMEGRTIDEFICAEDMGKAMESVRRSLSSEVEVESTTVRMKKKDGSVLWAEVNVRTVHDVGSGEPMELVTVLRDVTESKLLEERLAALAMTDGLTGLANRRAFDEALEREWKRTLREGKQISLLLLDIDHFKRFNDQNGHQVGDDGLRAVAAAALSGVRSTDIVARYGGEEIAIILPMVDAKGALEAAEKVRVAIESLRLTHDGNPEGGGWVTASIGAATALARHGGTMRMPECLLLAADSALYKAKQNGRNRVEVGLLIAPQEMTAS
jgi:diguanylate cyclase (GGDEF)-like protein/PAS domain S-box-containing protein